MKDVKRVTWFIYALSMAKGGYCGLHYAISDQNTAHVLSTPQTALGFTSLVEVEVITYDWTFKSLVTSLPVVG